MGDLVGTKVTVAFSDGSQGAGTLRNDGQGNLRAGVSSVPEPARIALFGGLVAVAAGYGGYRRERAMA